MRLLATIASVCGLLSAAAATAEPAAPAATRHPIPNDFKPPQVFKNLNLVRHINLEKGYVRETINVVVDNISKSPQSEYYLPFPSDVVEKLGGLEVHDIKDKSKKFPVQATEYDPSSPAEYYVIHFPKPLAPDAQQTLSISFYILRSLVPLPASIEQDDKQYLTHAFSAYASSAYPTVTQKTKVKLPGSDVPDYTSTSGLKSGSDPEKQGSALTYGPYDTAKLSVDAAYPVTVRYEFTKPVLTCSLLERDLEVSHWGGNLATEERYWLRNDGANLSNHFSRLSWTAKTYQGLPTSALRELKFPLKPGSVDPYFTDDIGNVSTSRYRPGTSKRDALLELKPRYPVFGGWKYSFRIGWNNALSSFLRRANGDEYVLKVPFLEGPKIPEGLQYERMVLRVILPEGAENVRYEMQAASGLPTTVESELGLVKTYMDTLGRTVLKLTASNVADEARDAQLVVIYEYPFSAGLRKPLTIAAGLLTIFISVYVIGLLDVSIKKR